MKLLFTPGPLTTSKTVKAAMQVDLGSRDTEFMQVVREIRSELLALGGVTQQDGYEAVLMQGAGTFGIESVISSAIPKDGRLILLVNGAYGERMAKIAEIHGISTQIIRFGEDEITDPEIVRDALNGGNYTHLGVVHCETTTGIFNPVTEIGALCAEFGVTYIVDSMSAFGAVPLNLTTSHIDFLVSSANKCIEGVPGFSFILCKHSKLMAAEGQSRTLSLDLHAQWFGLESKGQFRFTPPTHTLLAFRQALRELAAEGGLEKRAERYQSNFLTLLKGMEKMGFIPYLPKDRRGYIINSFLYPSSSAFDFERFYNLLNERGFAIYPGKLSQVDCFRIGNIGQLKKKHIRGLLEAISEVKAIMGF
ncbi:MAG: 2-aminoethylphosphonate--pyruvate transaminase [Bacteroidia bacterium]|nr:2-aminoethylphosphonate--pyruvate transaminase [Bacteroidia bacterium]